MTNNWYKIFVFLLNKMLMSLLCLAQYEPSTSMYRSCRTYHFKSWVSISTIWYFDGPRQARHKAWVGPTFHVSVPAQHSPFDISKTSFTAELVFPCFCYCFCILVSPPTVALLKKQMEASNSATQPPNRIKLHKVVRHHCSKIHNWVAITSMMILLLESK